MKQVTEQKNMGLYNGDSNVADSHGNHVAQNHWWVQKCPES